jgi:soluble lytic murein transglycosylase-like protein
MSSCRKIALLALMLGVVGTPSIGSAANIYLCVNSDGDETFTDTPRKGCKLYVKGLKSKPAYSKRTYVRSGAKVFRDWSEYEPIIKEASEQYNLPVYLIKAVISAESALDPHAISTAGAEGLMQLMPGTAADMRVRDSFDPRENIMGGARYLRMLANMFEGDLVLMIAGYNAGHNRVMQSGNKIPAISETREYVRRVLKYYYQYKKDYLAGQEKQGTKQET